MVSLSYLVKVVDPSFELKQRAIAGVTKVKQHLNKTKRTRNFNLPLPQLQSGSLKPLGRPMTASGPLMRNCQGIVAGRSLRHVCSISRALELALEQGITHLNVYNYIIFRSQEGFKP